jgi:hypothetical protein
VEEGREIRRRCLCTGRGAKDEQGFKEGRMGGIVDSGDPLPGTNRDLVGLGPIDVVSMDKGPLCG